MSDADYTMKPSEINLIRRAARARWPVTRKRRSRIVARLMELLDDPEADSRAVVNASKTLLQMDMANREPAPSQVHLHQHQAVPADAVRGMTLDEYRNSVARRAIGHSGDVRTDSGD